MAKYGQFCSRAKRIAFKTPSILWYGAPVAAKNP